CSTTFESTFCASKPSAALKRAPGLGDPGGGLRGELTLGFKVRGDGSHGSLQDPSRSRLTFDLQGCSGTRRSVRPTRVEQATRKTGRSQEMEGVMHFRDVPTTGDLEFVFGSSGYSALQLRWPE
ncbi:unnamed protein product, partial [Effrenium voratum]